MGRWFVGVGLEPGGRVPRLCGWKRVVCTDNVLAARVGGWVAGSPDGREKSNEFNVLWTHSTQ